MDGTSVKTNREITSVPKDDDPPQKQADQPDSLATDSPPAILDLVQLETKPIEKLDGVVIGTVVGLGKSGEFLVDYPSNPWARPLTAVSTLIPRKTALGRAVALMFVGGNPQKPIVMGLMQNPGETTPPAEGLTGSKKAEPFAVEADGERLVFSAEKEIILRCGKASICLTRSGKVLIRGAYLLNRSSGVNRIKGGSVQIN